MAALSPLARFKTAGDEFVMDPEIVEAAARNENARVIADFVNLNPGVSESIEMRITEFVVAKESSRSWSTMECQSMSTLLYQRQRG
jgi:hypothetical protein